MRHRRRKGKLGRESAHRNMMLRNMVTSLFDKERIKTTVPKAKQLRPFAERMVTLARKQDLHSRRLAARYILNKRVLKKLFDDIAIRYDGQNGGYTRIVLYRSRWGDGAEQAFVELTKAILAQEVEPKDKKKKAAKAEKEEAKTPKKKAAAKAEEPEPKKTKRAKKSEEKES